MFVKVTVGYEDGSSSRSSPLDLLLYDSQCWHCSLAGECNARPNNKCVFSAAGGSSSVQTFRIGKSITNSEGIVTIFPLYCVYLHFYHYCADDSHVCSLAHDAGSCERKEFRYYYNSLEVTNHQDRLQFHSHLLISTNLLTAPLSLYKTPPQLNIICFQFS